MPINPQPYKPYKLLTPQTLNPTPYKTETRDTKSYKPYKPLKPETL